MVALVNYTAQILVELIKLANMIVMVNKAIACGDRVREVFEREPGLSTPNEEIKPGDGDIAVSFEHVGLVYPGTHTESLTDIHFSVKKGETVGVIGGTGSGKTSLVHLIPRFYDITSGKLLVDGVEVHKQSLALLRNRSGVVLQKAVLFEEPSAPTRNGAKRMQRKRKCGRHLKLHRQKKLFLENRMDWIRLWSREDEISPADRNSV